MTIIEAIKSGKRFRRKGGSCWIYNGWGNPGRLPGTTALVTYEDLIADDFEIEEESVTVTRSQVMEALKNEFVQGLSVAGRYIDTSNFLKGLGFKE